METEKLNETQANRIVSDKIGYIGSILIVLSDAGFCYQSDSKLAFDLGRPVVPICFTSIYYIYIYSYWQVSM